MLTIGYSHACGGVQGATKRLLKLSKTESQKLQILNNVSGVLKPVGGWLRCVRAADSQLLCLAGQGDELQVENHLQLSSSATQPQQEQ
jgi:hypothetical protein